jgi:hypothetical protein
MSFITSTLKTETVFKTLNTVLTWLKTTLHSISTKAANLTQPYSFTYLDKLRINYATTYSNINIRNCSLIVQIHQNYIKNQYYFNMLPSNCGCTSHIWNIIFHLHSMIHFSGMYSFPSYLLSYIRYKLNDTLQPYYDGHLKINGKNAASVWTVLSVIKYSGHWNHTKNIFIKHKQCCFIQIHNLPKARCTSVSQRTARSMWIGNYTKPYIEMHTLIVTQCGMAECLIHRLNATRFDTNMHFALTQTAFVKAMLLLLTECIFLEVPCYT